MLSFWIYFELPSLPCLWLHGVKVMMHGGCTLSNPPLSLNRLEGTIGDREIWSSIADRFNPFDFPLFHAINQHDTGYCNLSHR